MSAIAHVDPGTRARLADVRAEVARLRQERNRLADHIDAAKKMIPQGSADEVTQSAEFRRVEALINDQRDLQLKIASAEDSERYILGRISGVEGVGNRETFLNDPHTLEELRMLAESSQPVGDRLLGTAISRDELLASWEQRRIDLFGGSRQMLAATGDVTLPSDQSRTQFYGIIPQLRRQLKILDLINTQPMDVGTFDYLQEGGSLDSGPAETAELTTKPSMTTTLTEATVKAQTIPVWQRLSRPQLADVPGLATMVNSRLRYAVERRLDRQILQGDGTGQNILGILNTAGIGSGVSGTGDTVNSDLIADALVNVLTAEAEPNGVVVHPIDYFRSLKVKTAGSGQRLDGGGAFDTTPATMWGFPAVVTPAMPQGTALVGDFQLGATCFIREGVNIRLSDSDNVDFVQNALKMLAEMRAGLACWRPVAFAKVTLSFPN
jgi:HK97 family phage major capsid protein